MIAKFENLKESDFSEFEEVIIFSSDKVGGIKTYVNSVAQTLSSHDINTKIISNVKNINSFVFSYFFGKNIFLRNKYKIITWGIYNLIPFKKSSQLCIFHGFPSFRQQGFLRFILNLFTIFVCKFRNSCSISISKYVHSILLDVYSFKTKVIRNSIPLSVINNSLRIDEKNYLKKIDITFLGRPTKFKFPLQMVNHIKYLSKKNYKVSIIGKSKYLDSLKNKFKDENITLHGNLEYESIRNILIDSKLIFNCSDSEPFGLIYLEALYNFCHIFSPRSGGALEIYSLLPEEIKPFFTFYDNLENSLHLLEKTIISSKENIKEISKNNFNLRKELELNFSNEKQIINLLSCFRDSR